MKINIKKLHPNAVIPKYAHLTDAGMDLFAVETKIEVNENGKMLVCDTGIAIEIPEGYVGLIFPRSSIYKTNLQLSNCVGVIDSGYRGSIKFMFYIGNYNNNLYKDGDRIGQIIIMPYPKVEFNEVDELSSSDRGDGGFGSTGK